MKNKIVVGVISAVLIVTLILGAIGIFQKSDENVDCKYNLKNSDYNKELKSMCETNNIDYAAYTTKEELGELEFNGYDIALHFDFNYFDSINSADTNTKKNLILSYLNFDKNTCYSKNIVEDAMSIIFTDQNDLENIFDKEEISDNFICVKNIQTNKVIQDGPYYLLNNDNIVEISKDSDGIFYAKNIVDYSTKDAASSRADAINIDQTNINSLIKKKYYTTDNNNYKLLSGNLNYKFKNNELELNGNNVYLSNKNAGISKTLLAKNIDRVFLREYEDNDEFQMYFLDKDGNIYKNKSDLVYEKMNLDYKFVNIYYVNDNFPVAETTDGKLYNIQENKLFDTYERKVYERNSFGEENYDKVKYNLKINLNDYSIYMDNKDTSYKVKYSFGDYLLTTDNYLFNIADGKLHSNNKVTKISIENIAINDVNDIHRIYISFDNNEELVLFDVYSLS